MIVIYNVQLTDRPIDTDISRSCSTDLLLLQVPTPKIVGTGNAAVAAAAVPAGIERGMTVAAQPLCSD
jgi:hypothetical protein